MEPPVFPWRIWCATAAIALVFFSFTLTTAVPVWLDDVCDWEELADILKSAHQVAVEKSRAKKKSR